MEKRSGGRPSSSRRNCTPGLVPWLRTMTLASIGWSVSRTVWRKASASPMTPEMPSAVVPAGGAGGPCTAREAPSEPTPVPAATAEAPVPLKMPASAGQGEAPANRKVQHEVSQSDEIAVSQLGGPVGWDAAIARHGELSRLQINGQVAILGTRHRDELEMARHETPPPRLGSSRTLTFGPLPT